MSRKCELCRCCKTFSVNKYIGFHQVPLLLGRQGQYTQALTLKVLVATIDAQWEGMGDVGSARYKLALLPPCPTIRVLSYSIVNFQKYSTLRVNHLGLLPYQDG